MTRKELMDELKLKSGGQLSEILENLQKCDFIRKYATIGKSERDALYQLTDLYSLFYTRFVANNSGKDKSYWSNMRNSGSRTAWSGYAFEQVCFHHIPQIEEGIGDFRRVGKCLFLVLQTVCGCYRCGVARRSDRHADRSC